MASTIGRQPIVVTHEGGVQFAAQIRSHRLLVDQPPRGGGDDAAPAPIELLGASLGTCVALYVQQFCHTRDLPYAGMRVEVQAISAANPNRVAQFDVRVVLPAELPSPYGEMLQRVAQSCPAHNTLTHGAEVLVHIEAASRISAELPPPCELPNGVRESSHEGRLARDRCPGRHARHAT